MGWMIFGAFCGVIAIGGIVEGSALGFFFWAIVGAVCFMKGYRPWAAARARQEAEAAAVKAAAERAWQEANVRTMEANQKAADDKRREEEFQETQKQIASSSGRQNLRRMVNELVEYAGSLRADVDNSSTLNGMTDTLSRLSADESITAAHKADPNIQHDVDDVLEQLAEIGSSGGRVANRLRRLLKDVEPIMVIPPAAPAKPARVTSLLDEPPEETSNWQ